MKTMLLMMVLVLAPLTGPIQGQDDSSPSGNSAQEEPPRLLKRVPEAGLRGRSEGRSDDLWYGTPGVRPGGDLLGPLLDLVREPKGLFDFRPRKVASYLPDRETAEFLRERW